MANDTELQIQDTDKQEIAESGAERTRARLAFVPRTDICETEDAVVLVADMPGVMKDNVDISLENDTLTINGYVEPERPEGYGLMYAEYRIGDFQRSFTISNRIDRDNIEASLKDGVLRVRLPKADPGTKKIEVSAQ